MPAIRTVRRSRRLSRRPPADLSEIDWEEYSLDPVPLQNTEEGGQDRLQVAQGSKLEDDSESFLPRRSTHTRRKQDGHIPRPPNAFMIFRSDLWAKEKLTNVEHDHRQISRIAGHCWNSLSPEERAPYLRKAAIAKEEHKRKYPNYKFSPVAKGKGGKRRSTEDVHARNARAQAVAKLMLSGLEGKELSAVTDHMDEYGAVKQSAGAPLRTKLKGLPWRRKSSRGKAKARASNVSQRPPSPQPVEPAEPTEISEPSKPSTTPYLDPPPSPCSQPSSPPPFLSSSPQSSSPPSSPELREPSPCLEEPTNVYYYDTQVDRSYPEDPAGLLGLQSSLLLYDYSQPWATDAAGPSGVDSADLRLDQLYPLLSKDTTSAFNFFSVDPTALDGTNDNDNLKASAKHDESDMPFDTGVFFNYIDYSQSIPPVPQEEDFLFFDNKSS